MAARSLHGAAASAESRRLSANSNATQRASACAERHADRQLAFAANRPRQDQVGDIGHAMIRPALTCEQHQQPVLAPDVIWSRSSLPRSGIRLGRIRSDGLSSSWSRWTRNRREPVRG